jgi:opacity protein-like surface antigen
MNIITLHLRIFLIKRLVLTIGCFVSTVFNLNAIEVSAGIGSDLGFILTSTNTNIPEPDKSQLISTFDSLDMTRWGVSAFLDAQYIEANLGFNFFTSSYSESGVKYEETDDSFNFGLKLKYSFRITETVRIFPLIGFDYSILTEAKIKTSDGLSGYADRGDLVPSDALDRFYLNLGIGVDFFVSQNVYIRGEFNYTFLFNTETQKDTIAQIESMGYNLSIFQNGPVFKAAVGYRFFNN